MLWGIPGISRLNYCNELCVPDLEKCSETSNDTEHYGQDVDWSGLQGQYHSSHNLQSLMLSPISEKVTSDSQKLVP